jgi:hypothetical protein
MGSTPAGTSRDPFDTIVTGVFDFGDHRFYFGILGYIIFGQLNMDAKINIFVHWKLLGVFRDLGIHEFYLSGIQVHIFCDIFLERCSSYEGLLIPAIIPRLSFRDR